MVTDCPPRKKGRAISAEMWRGGPMYLAIAFRGFGDCAWRDDVSRVVRVMRAAHVMFRITSHILLQTIDLPLDPCGCAPVQRVDADHE